MKKFLLSAAAVYALTASAALAADLPVKARPVVAPPPPAWDIAFGAGDRQRLSSSAASRSRTASRAPAAYFEPRYNFNPDLQIYAGMAGASISFPNRAAAEIDFYAGIRPTFGKLALDFGLLYYWYPGGQCFHANPAFGDDCFQRRTSVQR